MIKSPSSKIKLHRDNIHEVLSSSQIHFMSLFSASNFHQWYNKLLSHPDVITMLSIRDTVDHDVQYGIAWLDGVSALQSTLTLSSFRVEVSFVKLFPIVVIDMLNTTMSRFACNKFVRQVRIINCLCCKVMKGQLSTDIKIKIEWHIKK